MAENFESIDNLPAGETYDVSGIKKDLALIERHPKLLSKLEESCKARAMDIFSSGGLGNIIKKDDRVLYIGTGSGHVAQLIEAQTKSQVAKLDISDMRLPDTKDGMFILGNARFAPFQDQSLDVVTFIDVLHHCKNPKDIILEAKRVLKPTGNLILLEDTLPEKDKKWQRKIIFQIISKVDDLLNRQPSGINPHNYKSIEEWKDLFTELGFNQAVDIKSWHWGLFDFVPGLNQIPRTNHLSLGRPLQSTRFVFKNKSI